ncbi:MAG: imidazole glycerol phosphate synthase subunit HisH [Ignavibacteriales bacterium]
MIAIIDYGMGNVQSVYNTLDYIGEDAIITSDRKEIDNASHIILPGVGAFGDAMENLKQRGLAEVLDNQVIKKGKPFLGICLGMQLLAKVGHEHGHSEGLGWFEAEVVKFDFTNTEKMKIPHVGWDDINVKTQHPLFNKLKEGEFTFYFVHSFHMVCKEQKDIVATCDYGYEFTAIVGKDNIFATQFHPEKSQQNGLQIIENFVNWNP